MKLLIASIVVRCVTAITGISTRLRRQASLSSWELLGSPFPFKQSDIHRPASGCYHGLPIRSLSAMVEVSLTIPLRCRQLHCFH